MAVKKKVVEIDTQEAQTSVKDLRNQLKALKDTMLQTEKGTEEYNDALRKSADIMHTLKEQTEELNASAMDFGQIAGNCTKAVGGLVGGLQAAKAMMNLFGVENEDVIKSLQKMQSLMAITQALPAIDNGIKAFKRLGLVINSATAGLSTFKKALIGTGIGAAITALGLLVAHWDEVTDAMKRWGIIHQSTVEKLEEQKKKAEDLKEKLDEAKKAYNDWEKQQKVSNLGSEAKKQYDELGDSIKGAEIKLAEYVAEQKKLELEKPKGWKDTWKDLNEQGIKLQENISLWKAQQRAILDSAASTKTAEEEAKKAAEELKKLTEAYKKLTDEIALYGKSNKEKELSKLAKEEAEKVKLLEQAEKDSKVREERITAIRNYYAEERAKINKKYTDQEIKDAQEKASKELKLLEDNYKLQEAALQASLDNKEITLSQFNERKKELDEAYKEDYVSTLQSMLKDETLSVEKRLELYNKLNEARIPDFKNLKTLEDNYKLQEAQLQASLDNRTITLEQFNARKKELDDEYEVSYVNALQSILEDETLSIEQRLQLYQKLNEFRAPKNNDDINNADALTNAINASAMALNDFSDNKAWGNILRNIATLTANWDTLSENMKKINSDIPAEAQKAYSAYAQIAATALSAVAQMLNGLAAEQDTSNREGFESSKKLQIAGATMSMLAGITSAWASSMMLPFPTNVIIGSLLSAMMGTTGAFQIAKISQQQFDTKSSASAYTPSTSAITSIEAPVQYTQDVQGANIEGAIKDSRVYVVESDITNTQNRVSVTENEARF